MRFVPETQASKDWPRKVSQSVRDLITNIKANQASITTLQTETDWSSLADHADDAAAASGGVDVGKLYRTGSTVKVRIS